MRRWAACFSLITLAALTSASDAATPHLFVPIGGGYTEDSIRQFAHIALAHAQGAQVKILVVPSAYGTAPADRKSNLALAQNRTAIIAAACQAVISDHRRHCSAQLVPLLNRADAQNSANSLPFADPAVGGVFFLGGDQTVAMRVLADSPAEAAMQAAFKRGVVFSGTSAGDSVESANMVAGFNDGYGPQTEFRHAAVQVWWADSQGRQRGLNFGARGVLLDQHFYQRGRFGRLVNMVAQSADRLGGHGLLGIGIDFGTGVAVENDSKLRRVFGASSAAVIDFKTADAAHRWTGGHKLLSARGVLTQILAPDPHLSYSLTQRMPELDGHPVPFHPPVPWRSCLFKTPGHAEIILGGGLADQGTTPALDEFVAALQAAHAKRAVVVLAGDVKKDALRAAANYRRLLGAAGWKYPIEVRVWSRAAHWHRASPEAGYLLDSNNSAALAHSLADQPLPDYLHSIVSGAAVVLTEGAMTAAMGQRYGLATPVTGDDIASAAIASFRTNGIQTQRGLGFFATADLVPDLLRRRRWGTLYNLVSADRRTIAVGISESTAVVVKPRGSAECPAVQVVGTHPVVVLDGRAATFRPGANGALSALNVLMDVFAPGDRLPGALHQ